jgi:hypothetical protein
MAMTESPEPFSIDEEPTESAVRSRADGRPPEEAVSDDPERQAKAILEESEQRIEEGSRKAE